MGSHGWRGRGLNRGDGGFCDDNEIWGGRGPGGRGGPHGIQANREGQGEGGRGGPQYPAAGSAHRGRRRRQGIAATGDAQRFPQLRGGGRTVSPAQGQGTHHHVTQRHRQIWPHRTQRR